MLGFRFFSALSLAFPLVSGSQHPLYQQIHSQSTSPTDRHEFSRAIRRVAVIGAGPSGLQSAAALLENGLEVRLFERAAHPGGNWYHSDSKPIYASYPNKPLSKAAYEPDIPTKLPARRVFVDGDDGVTNDWRLREHRNPSPIWDTLTALSPPMITKLPYINYPEDITWLIPHKQVLRHVRQYASLVGLNSNDEEHANVTSYSTRVERVHKPEGSTKWTLTLRKLEPAPHSTNKVIAHWWTEEFDAVVVAVTTYDSPYVPPIPHLDEWATAYPESIHHSREYRAAEALRGKDVLIVGASISSGGIAQDIIRIAKSVTVSARHPSVLPMPVNASIISEIISFSEYSSGIQNTGVYNASLKLVNSTVLSGFDHIIFATGFRRSHPFLADFHNNTIVGYETPETKIAPIITDGTHLRSLHWTGHYIPDPTLAFMNVVTWTIGPYAALGIAKVWSQKARLPSIESMWKTYPGPGAELNGMHGLEDRYGRLFVHWLNQQSLEFGGKLVAPLPIDVRQSLLYFVPGRVTQQVFDDFDNVPRSQWPARNTSESDFASSGTKFSDGNASGAASTNWVNWQDQF